MTNKYKTTLKDFKELQEQLQNLIDPLFENFNNICQKTKSKGATDQDHLNRENCERQTRFAFNTSAKKIKDTSQILIHFERNAEIFLCLRDIYKQAKSPEQKNEIFIQTIKLRRLYMKNGFTKQDPELKIPENPDIERVSRNTVSDFNAYLTF